MAVNSIYAVGCSPNHQCIKPSKHPGLTPNPFVTIKPNNIPKGIWDEERKIYRPYGFDPDKGMFTPEQAQKDFKPGIIIPNKKGNVIGKTVGVIGTLAALALAIVYRKNIAQAAKNVVKAMTPIVKKVVDTVKPYIIKVVDKVKPYVTKVTGAIKPCITKAVDVIKPIYDKAKTFVTGLHK